MFVDFKINHTKSRVVPGSHLLGFEGEIEVCRVDNEDRAL